MSDQQTKQRTQAETLAALKASVRRTVPNALSIDVGSTDQHTGYGFWLSEVHTDGGGLLSVTDPKLLDQLTDDAFAYLADLDWDGVVGEDAQGYATIPLLREVPAGTRVIYAAQSGVFQYDGPSDHGAFEQIAITFGGGSVYGLHCDVGRVAPEGIPIPVKDDRVAIAKRERGQYPTWHGPWELSVDGHGRGFHRTKRDAAAEGLRVAAIADWHAGLTEQPKSV